MIEDDDLVEHFYCNEHQVPDVFKRRVEVLAREQGLDPTIRAQSVQGCLIDFRSKPRYRSPELLLSLLRRWIGTALFRVAMVRRIARASLEMRLFMRPGARGAQVDEHGLPESIFFRRRALAYLAGAWLRYGHAPGFVFANAREEAELVAALLDNLGCHRISVESTVGLIPGGNAVHFTPTAEVTSWLRRTW